MEIQIDSNYWLSFENNCITKYDKLLVRLCCLNIPYSNYYQIARLQFVFGGQNHDDLFDKIIVKTRIFLK